jgi:hypothetical protein
MMKMILQNEALKGQKLGVGKGEILEVDAKGLVEVEEGHISEALLASGFVLVAAGKKAKPEVKKIQAKVEAPVEETVLEEPPQEDAQEEAPAPVDVRKGNNKWRRN